MYSDCELKQLVRRIGAEPDTDYLEFMIHSSELMPGGSPYFQTEQDIESLYRTMQTIFSVIHRAGFSGMTLAEYYNRFAR